LSVFRSNKEIYAQLVDDVNGVTITSVSSRDKEITATSKTEASAAVGKAIAEKATKAGITTIAFDRNGYLYHGRVKVLADAAREAGLKF
jgi:large subunit ribosomal protein L18